MTGVTATEALVLDGYCTGEKSAAIAVENYGEVDGEVTITNLGHETISGPHTVSKGIFIVALPATITGIRNQYHQLVGGGGGGGKV